MTGHLVLLGSFEKPLEVFVHKVKVKSKSKVKPVSRVLCFPPVTSCWRADAEQMVVGFNQVWGFCQDILDGREREGVEGMCKGKDIWIEHRL